MIAQVPAPSLQSWFDQEARWWLRSPSFSDSRLRVGRRSLPEVVEALRIVYDEGASRRLVQSGHWPMLLGLFSAAPWLEWLGMMLAVGEDLCDAPELLEDPDLIQRLRSGDHFWGARVELGGFAGFRRRGLAAKRPKIRRDLAQWDIQVDLGENVIAIECKALSEGQSDGNFGRLRERFENCVALALRQGPIRDATLELTDSAVDAIDEVKPQAFFDEFLREFTVAVEESLRQALLTGEEQHVADFGLLTLRPPACEAPGFLGQANIRGYQRSNMHRLRRVVNSLASANDNFRGASAETHRVAVVWMGQAYLRAPAVAWFLRAHLGGQVRARNVSLDLGSRRFHFDTGVVLGARQPVFARDWAMERGRVAMSGAHRPLPRTVLRGLCGWALVARLDQG